MNEWILVIDDDAGNLKAASHILRKSNMRSSCVRSGEEALRFLNGGARCPDLILLDIHMPGMDGFETLGRIREDPATASIPVVFLTADEDSGSETRGLQAGAMDFIKKPFVPEVLLTRVRHIIDLTRLQNDLSLQVRTQTAAIIAQQEKLNRLSIQIVMALAGAVDAKDNYTNGHSRRVAEYAREIAQRFGYSSDHAETLYLIGLLHDIGKIGIPDTIINKPGRLTEGEFEKIKQHPILGSQILGNISELPELAIGAHWHHERYDGRGYPDHLSGQNIPEEARIIAVADSYDAMTSRRSYREGLPQNVVRGEIERGSGTQFDPVFAEIMLRMMEADRDYRMRQT